MEPSTEAQPRFENPSLMNTRLVDLPNYLDQIIYLSAQAEKIQSLWKGYKTRKGLLHVKLERIKQQHLLSQRGECITLSDGSVYTGKLKDMKRHGEGVQEWPDGSYFKGQWSHNKACKFGYFSNANGDTLQGWYVDDKSNGKAVYRYLNGNFYHGDWKSNKRTGFAIEKMADITYTGFFSSGLKHGFGQQVWKNGTSYVGTWENDKMNGFGTYTWADGTLYKGYWLENAMHGTGLSLWPDGRTYEGEYYMSRKHGFGVYTWTDGKQYKGHWKEGRQHGKGVLTTPKGDLIEGVWDMGRRIRD